jgi:hypothetical protein
MNAPGPEFITVCVLSSEWKLSFNNYSYNSGDDAATQRFIINYFFTSWRLCARDELLNIINNYSVDSMVLFDTMRIIIGEDL